MYKKFSFWMAIIWALLLIVHSVLLGQMILERTNTGSDYLWRFGWMLLCVFFLGNNIGNLIFDYRYSKYLGEKDDVTP